MTKLYLTFSERRTGGEPLDSGPWSDRAPTYIEFSVTGASAVEVTGWNVKTLNVDFDAVANRQVVLVIVRYRDGDTFGYSTGNWEIVGGYASMVEALAKKAEIEAREDDSGYRVWEGYFSSLESVEVVGLPVII